MKFTPKQVFAVSFLAFVLSGFSGLIYQSIWTRYLGLVLGHAAFAQTLVLALFMGGMAFGAWWSSKLVNRHGLRVLRTYAIIEVIVGIAALCFHFIFVQGTDVFQSSILPNLGSEFMVSAFKWSWAALLILPQCVLLGMTFPLLSTGLIRLSDKVTGEVLGTLYFTNSIGAAVGALVATFLLVPAIGLPGAMATAGIINLLAGVLVFSISRGENPGTKQIEISHVSDTKAPHHAQLILWCAFFTGLSSFVYEVAWVRMLALALGSTVHAFEIMISSFVAGLALGSFWIRKRIDRLPEPLIIAGWAQLLMGLAALSTIFSYKLSFYGVANLTTSLAPNEGGYVLFNLASAAIAMLLMFPTAFFAGMTLPVFTASLLRSGGGEQAIGKVYATNTIGAICGVFITVHLLLPFLGLKSTILLAALIDIALGVAIFHKLYGLRQPRYLTATCLSILAVVVVAFSPKLDEKMLVSGVYRLKQAILDTNSKVLYYRDGKTATISASVTGSHMAIATNGKVDAAVQMNTAKQPSADEETMIMLGLMPMLYRPEATIGANIGFGSGISTHILLGNPKLKALDTIEIESAVIEGAQVFGDRNARAYTDPRSKIILDDAKTYFAGNNKKYDFIVSEPSNPWVSGVASLFSEEFYKFLPHHLNENGILVQWIQLYEIDFALVASMMKALGNNFSDYDMYISNSNDLIIVAQHKGKLSASTSQSFGSVELANELKRHGLTKANDLNFRFVANKQLIEPLINSGSLAANSDYYPVVSHLAPKARFMQSVPNDLFELPFSYIPFVELLTPEKRAPLTTYELNTNSSNQRFFYLSQAFAIAKSLNNSGPVSAVLDEDMRKNLAIMVSSQRHCTILDLNDETLHATIRVHAFLAANLPQGIVDPRSNQGIFGCAQDKLPSHFKLVQDFLSAVAKRDLPSMAAFGQQTLDTPELKKIDILQEMALCSAVIFHVQQNNRAAGHALMTKYREVRQAPNTRALRKLLAVTVQPSG